MGKPRNFNSCGVLTNVKVIINFILKIKTQTDRFRYMYVYLARRF